ncbi:cell division protein FtsL [Fusibacter paucivorans]|uniref:Cell division protein FtsL n=1 Tax=Fusibacter paucivorans TaxID=76009 RepID=A0ABS5PQU3_9FIRM|nr:septum formation initiator family protein [Fusibacter paucivorans]MBS7527533.1 cell division protein FtsL [Fusibacter paucivorans]
MLASREVLHEEEIMAFNKDQSAKIVAIRKKRLERENAKHIMRERLKTTLITVVLLAVFSSMFAVLIYKNSLVNEKKYEIFTMKTEIKSLNTQIEELQTAVENSTDIKTVEKMAKEQLNMQYPTSNQYVYIDATAMFAVSETTLVALAERDNPKAVELIQKESKMNDMIAALFRTN